MDRRAFLFGCGTSALLPPRGLVLAQERTVFRRVRPSDAEWPDPASWDALNRAVGGRLAQVRSPLIDCVTADALHGADCANFVKYVKNPFYLGDEVGLTQNFGWVDAWVSRPSAYAVAVSTAADVVAAVNFARAHRLRLVIKGGGHSYLGTSNASDSLLIWTRRMNDIVLHDAFVPQGCARTEAPHPAVSVGAGAIWLHVYDAVTTKAGRYVQGGGCTTVGVAGLIQSGGFGTFSKRYGLAAGSLVEAEVVTSDGVVRIANSCTNPDLFWALKGGGGGSLGVVTRLTLKTHALPDLFGSVSMTIRATDEVAYRRLIGQVIAHYAQRLFNPSWGEQFVFRRNNELAIRMVFQGLSKEQAEAIWEPFFSWVAALPQEFNVVLPPRVVAIPARRGWDVSFLTQFPNVVLADDRPGANGVNFVWAGDAGQPGQFIHGFQSTWLPQSLLSATSRDKLSDALFAATRHWGISLHLNKGLAGAPAEELAAARNTATNPAVVDAFALAICGAEGPPAYPGVTGYEPDVVLARSHAVAIDRAMSELRFLVPEPGSYVSESNFFEPNWQRAYWGSNYPRLLAIKRAYDPDGLFFVHNGVGSEQWTADGFTKLL